jgi:hypothetical protein
METTKVLPRPFYQILDEREANPGALEAAAFRPLHAVEAFEDVRQLVRRDARAGVAHRELHMVLVPGQRE